MVKIQAFDRFTWKHVATILLQDIKIMAISNLVALIQYLKKMCMYVLDGSRGEGGNHLDDYGPNLLVSSGLVNRAHSARGTNEWTKIYLRTKFKNKYHINLLQRS